jgi:hypothetical protein
MADKKKGNAKASALFQRALQKPWRLAWIGTIATILAGVVGFSDNAQHILREFNGPDVVLTIIPQGTSDTYGKPDLLNEYRFDKTRGATHVETEEDVRALFDSRPLSVGKLSCHHEDNSQPTSHDYYELNIGIQNLGWQTAKDYSIAITFSGQTKPDPGVRIALVESDGLDISYLYQQKSKTKIEVPSCIKEDVSDEQNNKREQHQEIVSNLARKVYKQVGLTRDVVILRGNLEAQEFQTVNLLVKIPSHLKKFAVIYNVECANCQWFYRTESFAQIVQPSVNPRVPVQ